MCPSSSRSKLDTAALLLRFIAPVFAGSTRTFTLVNSWYMKWPYLEKVLGFGFHSIGQGRRDTALHDIPGLQSGRGRPRKYGAKYTAERVATLPEDRQEVCWYGKTQWVR